MLVDRSLSTYGGQRDALRCRASCIVTKGFSYKSAELVEGSDTLINLKNMGRGGIFEHRGFKPLTPDRYKESQVVRPGEVVVSMTDLTQNRDVVARPIRVPDVAVAGRMIASLDLAIVRPVNGFSNEFLAAVLAQEDFHEFALGYCNGTTVVHMSAKAFEDYRLPAVTQKRPLPLPALCPRSTRRRTPAWPKSPT